MRSFPCQLHQPLAWRVFVARIDIVYIATIWGASTSNNIFFISIFYHQDKIAKISTFSLRHPVILRRLLWGSVSTTTTTPCVTDGKEKTEGPMVSCRQPRLGKWRGGENKFQEKYILWKWQTLQNSESRWLLKDSFLTPSVTFNIRSNTVILLKTFHK